VIDPFFGSDEWWALALADAETFYSFEGEE